MHSKIGKVTDGMDEFFKFSTQKRDSAEKVAYSNYSYWRSTWRMFCKNRAAMFFMSLLLVILAFTLIQPFLPNQKGPTTINLNEETGRQDRNVPPNNEYWFGTNSIGQDLWARVWSGTRTSLVIGFSVGLFNVVFGMFIGTLWGYVRKADAIITEIYNVLHNIPNTIILVLVAYVLRPALSTMIFAMCITGWLSMARFIRNQIIIIRDREFNLASRCLGTPVYRVVSKNLLPHLVSVIVMQVALSIPIAIGNEVFLTYIGLGLPIAMPSLGNLINEGRSVMMSAAARYQLVFPAIVLSVVTISFYVIGNAFADAADPRTHL